MKMVPLLLLLFILFSPLAFSADCPDVDWDMSARVGLINDGDTITLDNGRLVRFIGINTPEINHRYKSRSEPYALKAKELLQRYVRVGDKVHLVFDKTRRDKYGRQLAYVYSKTGRNLALLQLKSGYAKQWVVGKNDRFWRCFQDVEKEARLRKRGIWSAFKPLRAGKITKEDKGYQYIRGQISRVVNSNKGIEFFLDRRVKVRISAANLKKFTANGIDFVNHDRILISGKVTFSGAKPQLRLYHPVQILP
jgi:micrococcal nuclease